RATLMRRGGLAARLNSPVPMKLNPLDLIIIVVYMLGVTGVGWYFSRKQRNIRDYFLSDKNTPFNGWLDGERG
ncbi:MAG: hypothetical protein MUF15_21695, partial [Acidobacteria bacterium]|nr:hypothetical protein [Acidobacteriota bacterium]